ncbi:MAG: hypothetical protein NTW86_25785 [Candidatus Sumerlaeota bacterium]|nr:hypothetical protein [Candidatus Sumerlaeota bacterium]
MGLSQEQLKHCLNAAIAAAYQAGARVMKHYGTAVDVGSKGGLFIAGDVVTVADREAQDAVFGVLRGFDDSIGMLSEEEEPAAAKSRFEKECFWCIDPLDGTLPFLERTNGFAISIGLVSKEGEPLMGVVYAPAFSDLYCAIQGGPALKNGQPLRIGEPKGTFHLSTSANDAVTPERNRMLNFVMEGLAKLDPKRKMNPVLHAGAVVKACWIIENPPAAYITFPRPEGGVSVWDCAATACIVKAAGGWVSDFFGNPLELNRRESTYMHHRGLVYASNETVARTAIERYAEWQKTKES